MVVHVLVGLIVRVSQLCVCMPRMSAVSKFVCACQEVQSSVNLCVHVKKYNHTCVQSVNLCAHAKKYNHACLQSINMCVCQEIQSCMSAVSTCVCMPRSTVMHVCSQ